MQKRPVKSIPKDTYDVASKHASFYTGGKVQVSADGRHLLSTCRDAVKMIDISTGQVIHTIKEDEDPAVTCFHLAPDDENLVVSSENNQLRLWDWSNNRVVRTWKAIHNGPILEMIIDKTSTLLVTGGSDSTIKIWDIARKYWTHNLKGHKGIITALTFHTKEMWLCSAAMDLHIKIWDLQNSNCIASLEGHFSAVTCLVFDPLSPSTLLSGGRDNVVLCWDVREKKRTDTIPVYESIESLVLLDREENKNLGVKSEQDLHFLTAGSKGFLRVWSLTSRQCVHKQTLPNVSVKQESEIDETSLTAAFCIPSSSQVCTVTHEHNIQFYNAKDLSLDRQYIGHNDEIMDLQLFGEDEQYLAVASNSTKLKVYDLETFDSELLHGHTDLVVTVAVSGDGKLLISGSKDQTAILWGVGDDIHDITHLYTAQGHTQNVTAVALSRLKNDFFLTAAMDNTLKLWKNKKNIAQNCENIRCVHTCIAHDKDINSIEVSPNDKLIVTASKDKTAKVWNRENLGLVGVLQGHRRGLWKAKFSPVDQCIITASADGTVKIFAISNFTCVKTFEGHESPVLNVCFVHQGMQFVSSDDVGLIKLWTIKSNELVSTFEGHDERCWALTCSKDNEAKMISGAADSAIIVWKDITEEKVMVQVKKNEKMTKMQQELSNLLHEKRYHEALSLALTMEQPFRVLTIIREIIKLENEETLCSTVELLNMAQIDVLLRFCVDWNTNSRNCHEAQLLLNKVLRIHSPDELLELPNIKSILEGLIPYTERHYQRVGQLVQKTQFVEYTWQCMRLKEDSTVLNE